MRDKRTFFARDLVMLVSHNFDSSAEARAGDFLDALCEDRPYQRTAIEVACRFLFGGHYASQRDLALENFQANSVLQNKYGNEVAFLRSLPFPDKLAATLDLATGTGKSYVIFGVASLALAFEHVDQVVVLCPSVTIEAQLYTRFAELSSDSELIGLLPIAAYPKVIDGSTTIEKGTICVENYHAILDGSKSSVRSSLRGKGSRTLVINDECHHVVNETASRRTKWREFLESPDYGFHRLLGVSGTCFSGNHYFSDVIFRYSLRDAIRDKFIKTIEYVADMPPTNARWDRWQMIYNRHEDIGHTTRRRGIAPITIVVTNSVSRCKELAREFKSFLVRHTSVDPDDADELVLAIYNESPDVPRMRNLDSEESMVEWIFSVSMLNEGWDVHRVFQIVPHEERAFNSKLLISQVLGRGLRVPKGWGPGQPVVSVFNHEAWAPRIRHLVDEILEVESRLQCNAMTDSKFHFDLHNINYRREEVAHVSNPDTYNLFEKGYVDLASDPELEYMTVSYERADTHRVAQWQTVIRHETFSVSEVATEMYQRLEEADDNNGNAFYTTEYPLAYLADVVKRSLQRIGADAITDGMRQRFLQSLGTLRRSATKVVRYIPRVDLIFTLTTSERPSNSITIDELKRTKTVFYSEVTLAALTDDERDVFVEISEAGSGYKVVFVPAARLVCPLVFVVADFDAERKFILQLVEPQNIAALTAWVKNTSMGFYEIEYYWKKGTNPKRGRFSPGFFLAVKHLRIAVVVLRTEDTENVSAEVEKKSQFGQVHFAQLNRELEISGSPVRYKLTFLAPADFGAFFDCLRRGTAASFRSSLDVHLAELDDRGG